MTKNSNQGLALAVVLLLLFLVSLLGAGVLILTSSHYRLTQHSIDSIEAFYLAEAGINRGLYKMRTEATPSNETGAGAWSFEGTGINITFSTTDPLFLIYTIIATVDITTTSGAVFRSIQVVATRSAVPPPITNISSVAGWQEL